MDAMNAVSSHESPVSLLDTRYVTQVLSIVGISFLYTVAVAFYAPVVLPVDALSVLFSDIGFLVSFLVVMGLLFTVNLWIDRGVVSYFMYALFCTLEGLLLLPLLAYSVGRGGISLVLEAGFITGGFVILMGIAANMLQLNLAQISRLKGWLFIATLGLIVVSLLGLFFDLSGSSLIMSFVGIILFNGWLLSDFASLSERNLPPLLAGLSMYISILGLFRYVLYFLSSSRD